MKTPPHKYEKETIELLERLRPFAPRDPQNTARGRRQFLREAAHIRAEQFSSQAVSVAPFLRLKEQIKDVFRKETRPMMIALTSVVVALSLFFGGTGAAVYAAQDSLPTDQLYSLKLFSEDSRLELASGPQSRLNLALEYTARRVNEAQLMVQQGKGVPEGLVERLQNQTMLALQIAANLDNEAIPPALAQARQCLEEQLRIMDRLQANNQGQQDPVLAQIRETLRERLRLVEAGLDEPTMFRERLSRDPRGFPTEQPGGSEKTVEPKGEGYGPGPQASQEPRPQADGYGPGPQTNQTPAGEGGYGPGPSGTCTATPQMDGSGGGYGPGPQATQTPGSGGGYGPGPQASQTPEPNGDGYGPGPQASQTAEPGGGGYGPGPSGTCTATPQMDGSGGGGNGNEGNENGGNSNDGGDGNMNDGGNGNTNDGGDGNSNDGGDGNGNDGGGGEGSGGGGK